MDFRSPVPIAPKKASPLRVFNIPDAQIAAAREQAKLNKAKQTRGILSTIGDMASAGGQATLGTVQAITDFVSPTSKASNYLRDLPQYWKGIESPQYKAKQEVDAAEMEAIAPDDWVGRGMQTAQNVIEDPFGSAAKLTGSMLPFVAAAPLGLPAMSGLGAAVGGGSVRGGVFENVLSTPDKNLMGDPRYAEMRSRMPEQDAKVAFGELMSSFGESGAEIGTGALLGGVTGALGAEASAVKAMTRGATRNALTKQAAQLAPTAIAKGALSEGGQEVLEEGGQQYLANVAAASGGANIDPWQNVIEGAVEGGLLGMGGGGVGKVAEGMAGRSRLNALNVEEGFVAPPSAKPKIAVQNAEIKSQQALENPALDEDDESGEMDPAAIASLSVPNPNADLAQVFGYVPPATSPEVPMSDVGIQPPSEVDPVAQLGTPETVSEQPISAPSELPVEPSQGIASLTPKDPKEIAKAEREAFKLQEKILKAQQAEDAKRAKEEAKPLVIREQSLQRLSDTIPPESGIQAIDIPTPWESPSLDAELSSPASQAAEVASPAAPLDQPAPASVDTLQRPSVSPVQEVPNVAQAPQAVNPARETSSISDANEEQDLESLLQQSVQNPTQKAAPKSAAPKSTPVPSQTVYAGDKVQVGDQIGEAVGNQAKGMVTVRYPDGTTKIERASFVKKVAPEPQSSGNRQELVGKLREAIPANHPKKAEIDSAIQAWQENDTAENEGVVSRALKDAGLWKSANPFDTAVAAIAKNQDPVEAAIRQGHSRTDAEKAAKKAESFVNKKKAAGTWTPKFSRDFADRAVAEAYKPNTLGGMVSSVMESLRNSVPKAVTKLQLKAEQMLEGPMTEEIWQSYNGIKDSARAALYRDAIRVKIGKSRFVIADFEGDVPSSVVSDLARITEDLAGRMQSVSKRIAGAAGTQADAFAGFAPSGNLAGVTLGKRVYLNPLKHLKGIVNTRGRIARRLLNTLVHELAHANGFDKHDNAFEAEQGRIWDAIKKANLIEGMESEIARGLDNELISKLNGIYDTAQKGWYNARYKARKLSGSEGRQSDRAVPRVSTEGDRASGVSPPDGNREGVSSTRKSERGSSEELGTASEDGRVDETEAGGADQGRAGVLEPSFSREPEEETEITLPQDTWSQKRVYEYVDSKAKIQTMMEIVEAATGKRADVDLHEASIAVSSITAHEIKQLNDFHRDPLAEFMKANKISTKEAGRYIWAKENIDGAIDPEKADESRAVVEEIESGDKADAFNEIDTAVKRIIQVGRGAAIDSGLSTKDNVAVDGPEEGVVQRILEKAARTIVKANENRFRTQLGTFLAKNPSPEWAINPKKAVGGKTIPYYVHGKKQRIWIKDKVLGEQIESLSDGENSWFMDGVRRMTRGFAVVNTRANPVFPVKNFIRDLMFGLGKIYVDDGPKIMGETWRGLRNAIPTMWKYHKNPNYWKDLSKGSDEYKWGAAAELLYRSGGIPQWFGLPSQDAIKELLDTDIKGFDASGLDSAKKPFIRFWNGMKMLSEVSEGATRLAYLKTLVDPSVSGKQIPIQEAIKKARGITGDFQRHGNKKNMRYAYAFFNSSIQGAAAMANLTKELRDGNPRARNLAMFLVGLGMSQALAGMLAGDADGDDQNDYEQLPEYLKNSNLIIPVPGHPVAIPLPYGLNVPIVFGMGLVRSGLSDEPGAVSKSAINVMHSMMKSFNPMGDEASLAQFISPTVLDPLIQASENLDSLGRKINRDRYYGEEKLPESQITSRKDSAPAKAIASAMNRLGGGDEVTPAKISFMDVHPGTIDNTAAWLMGAAGRFVKDSGLAAASVAKGEEPKKIPFWHDFVKTPKNSFYTGRFWEQLDEIRSFKDAARQLDENARREQAIELGLDESVVESMTRDDLKKRIQLSKSKSDAISKRIEQTAGQRAKLLPMYEDLRKQISALQKSNDPNSDDRIIELVKAANRKYVEATR